MSGWERNLGVRWVTANVLGWLVGFALCNALQSFLSTFFVDGLVIGSAVGIAQWLVLRRPVSPRGGRVVASIIGFRLGSAMREVLLPGASTVGSDRCRRALSGLAPDGGLPRQRVGAATATLRRLLPPDRQRGGRAASEAMGGAEGVGEFCCAGFWLQPEVPTYELHRAVSVPVRRGSRRCAVCPLPDRSTRQSLRESVPTINSHEPEMRKAKLATSATAAT